MSLLPPAQPTSTIDDFLAAEGWADARRVALAGDASARRYRRLHRDSGPPAILAESPFPDADVVPFVQIGRLLAELGFSVPAILAERTGAGLLLLEDFGDDTFSRLLARAEPAPPLYELAVDVLIALHRRFHPALAAGIDLPLFDPARFIEQVMLFADAYLPAAFGRAPTAAERAELEQAWWAVVPAACAGPQSLILRDYHVDNLMWLESRPGIRACGLLDYQSAGLGPVGYDLVSLIEDARRDVPEMLGQAMVERYLAEFPEIDRAAFTASCDVLGAIRHARVIAIFTHIAVRQGRRGYLVHLPRVWRMLERRLAKPALAPVAAWFDRFLPDDRRGSHVIPEA